MTLSQSEAEKLALQMARAIWKQMNFRGGNPTREWDTLTPDMQQPILDSCRVGLEAVRREIENAAYEQAVAEAATVHGVTNIEYDKDNQGIAESHASEFDAGIDAGVGYVISKINALIHPPAQKEDGVCPRCGAKPGAACKEEPYRPCWRMHHP